MLDYHVAPANLDHALGSTTCEGALDTQINVNVLSDNDVTINSEKQKGVKASR
mgnify:FL=1